MWMLDVEEVVREIMGDKRFAGRIRARVRPIPVHFVVGISLHIPAY